MKERQEGVALIITLMVLMLVSVLMVGFFAAVVADTRASGLDRDQTQAYAAAHAGLEQITTDLSALFTTDFSPNATQIAALRATPPALPGFDFIAPGGTTGSGYWVEPRFTNAGNPQPEDAVNGSVITSGPYQGFRGIITPYDITVTARSRGGAEVRMRRTLQTVAIPVFQFGMFSETDLAFHAGETFGFGGRVHTNGNLFLANATGGTLTIADRVTAFRDIIRTHLPNGLVTTSNYTGTVRIPTTIASNPANNVYRSLQRTEGSLQGTIGSQDNPNWVSISTGTYLSNIRNGDTGAKRLDLPLVADLDNDGEPDAQPIELVRRPSQGSNEDTANPIVYTQRFYGQASIRILLSDTAAEIMSLPTIDMSVPPMSLESGSTYWPGLADPAIHAPLAASGGPSGAAYGSGSGALPASVYRSDTDTSLIGGFIKIEIQRAGTTPTNGTWEDVTSDILALGITGRNLADSNNTTLSARWNRVPDSWPSGTDVCAEPNPNAVIRLQRVRDIPIATLNQPCGLTAGALISTNRYDYWPLALYDTREGQTRDGVSVTNMFLGGIMHYVELDVNNLRRWLSGAIGTRGTSAKNDNGYILYFSDRRGNKNGLGVETSEYGYEDTVNLNSSTGTPNGTLDTGEDVNANGVLDVYGRTPRPPAGAVAPLDASATPFTQLSVTNSALVARANRPIFFRRALKLVNGGLGSLPPGFTVVSENPVYVHGNYNATATSVTATTNVPAALIADAVTTLSNNWSDLRSFTFPTASLSRPASSTGYRMAVVAGKTLAFPQPSGTSASFGSDGGAHNFFRQLEQWDNGSIHRYRGSMVSFFISRQANGSFKCCSQDAYNRGDRDWSFDTDFLLPSRLPPGTPMFRDVNTLTFRQLLRPTQ